MIDPIDCYSFELAGVQIRIDGAYARFCGKILLGVAIGWPSGILLWLLVKGFQT